MVDLTEMTALVQTALVNEQKARQQLEGRVAMLENAVKLLSRHVGYSDSHELEDHDEDGGRR